MTQIDQPKDRPGQQSGGLSDHKSHCNKLTLLERGFLAIRIVHQMTPIIDFLAERWSAFKYMYKAIQRPINSTDVALEPFKLNLPLQQPLRT